MSDDPFTLPQALAGRVFRREVMAVNAQLRGAKNTVRLDNALGRLATLGGLFESYVATGKLVREPSIVSLLGASVRPDVLDELYRLPLPRCARGMKPTAAPAGIVLSKKLFHAALIFGMARSDSFSGIAGSQELMERVRAVVLPSAVDRKASEPAEATACVLA